ncbi:glucosylglycerol hydrolase [Spirochaeta dissipatitropha]
MSRLFTINPRKTDLLLNSVQGQSDRDLVRLLGAHPAEGYCNFGFYLPDAVEAELILFRCIDTIDFTQPTQTARFHKESLPLQITDGYGWLAVDGIRAGSTTVAGDFYLVRSRKKISEPFFLVRDPLAHSVPFGASGPAEVYRLDWPERKDRTYLQERIQSASRLNESSPPRLSGPSSILQIHVPTATREGSLAALSRLYREIAAKIEQGLELQSWEQSFVGYDAVQLMPIEPIIEYEGGKGFWQEHDSNSDSNTDADRSVNTVTVTVDLKRPDMSNWGYDIMTLGSPAVNPCLLESGRPDELLDFIETMHGFPGGGIQVILDIVYGHADNQSQALLQPEFIAGPGMYGQVLDYRNPAVRQILLEMQRRKSCFGIDGLRVDGAQDFKYFDPEQNRLIHDDEYLHEMNDQCLEVAGLEYLPWMIFEDGRPWPADDWELSSSYMEVTRQMPNVYQWGPLTFAHNTPFVYTFWAQKWWRVREIFTQGQNWITGCANHDTLRRGTQVDPEERVNSRLGEDYREIFRKGYDNPAAQLLAYTVMPGVPMDFIQSNLRTPWSFIRNTDKKWAVKVVSEESRFLTWAVDEALYNHDDFFVRLKGFGFSRLEQLRAFSRQLDIAMKAADYHTETAARILDAALPNSPLSPHGDSGLESFSRAWMDDLHEYCNISHWLTWTDSEQAAFHYSLRSYRRSNPAMAANINPETDTVFYLEPCDGAVVYAALRKNPKDNSYVLFLANMEGREKKINLADVLNRAVELGCPLKPEQRYPQNWIVQLKTPKLYMDQNRMTEISLGDSQGCVLGEQPAKAI